VIKNIALQKVRSLGSFEMASPKEKRREQSAAFLLEYRGPLVAPALAPGFQMAFEIIGQERPLLS